MRQRITLYRPGSDEPAISGWARLSQAGGVTTATPERGYPDAAPAVGWHLDCRAGRFLVSAVTPASPRFPVTGDTLTLEEAAR